MRKAQKSFPLQLTRSVGLELRFQNPHSTYVQPAEIGGSHQVVAVLYPSCPAPRQLFSSIHRFRGFLRRLVPPHKGDQIFLRNPPSLPDSQTLQFTAAQPLIDSSAIHFEPRRNLFWGVEIWQAHFLKMRVNTLIQSGRRDNTLLRDSPAVIYCRAL